MRDFDSLIICLIGCPIKCRDPVGVGSDKPIIFRGSRRSNIWVCRLIMFIKNLENEWFLSKEAANCGYAAAHPVPPPLHYYFKERLSNQSFLEEIHILKIFEIKSKWFLSPKKDLNLSLKLMSRNLYFSECIRTNPDQFDTLCNTVCRDKQTWSFLWLKITNILMGSRFGPWVFIFVTKSIFWQV